MVDIQVSDITNGDIVNKEWVGTGVFDVLMDAVNKNINIQYQNNRITGNDYANVYLGSLQAVLAQSVQYALQEKVAEAQIDNLIAQTALTEEQEKDVYTSRVIKDKQAANLGLDLVVKAANSSPEAIYTPKYEE